MWIRSVKKDNNTEKTNSDVNELLQEQNELYANACQELSGINQKVIELNNKIHSMKGKLTEDQNKTIDEIETMRASINTRMKGVRNVSRDNRGNFKTTLVKDINNIKNQIEEVLNSIK